MFHRPPHQVSGDPIYRPEPVHLQPTNASGEELAPTEHGHDGEGSVNSRPRVSRIVTSGKVSEHWYDRVKKFWRHQVRVAVPHVDCRDHYANERTFLGYLRTSTSLSMLGVVIAQLLRLERSISPSPVFGFFITSKPLAGLFQGAALGVILLGAIRYLRQQSAMARGKVHAGGWEIFLIVGFLLLLMAVLFAVVLGIDIYQDKE